MRSLEDPALVRYIHVSLHHQFCYLERNARIQAANQIPFSALSPAEENFVEGLLSENASPPPSGLEGWEGLTQKERFVLQKIFVEGFRDAEIARCLGISRQAVGKTKRHALKKLEKIWNNL